MELSSNSSDDLFCSINKLTRRHTEAQTTATTQKIASGSCFGSSDEDLMTLTLSLMNEKATGSTITIF